MPDVSHQSDLLMNDLYPGTTTMLEQRLTCSSDPGLAKNDPRGGTVAATGQMNQRAAVAAKLAALPLSLPTSEPAAALQRETMSRVV